MSTWAALLRRSAEYARKSLEEIAQALRSPPTRTSAPSYEPAYSRNRDRHPGLIGSLNRPNDFQKRWLSASPHCALMAPFFRSNYRRGNRILSTWKMMKGHYHQRSAYDYMPPDFAEFAQRLFRNDYRHEYSHLGDDFASHFHSHFMQRFERRLQRHFQCHFQHDFQHFEKRFQRRFERMWWKHSGMGQNGHELDPFKQFEIFYRSMLHRHMHRHMMYHRFLHKLKSKMRVIMLTPLRGLRNLAHTAYLARHAKYIVSCPVYSFVRRHLPALSYSFSTLNVNFSQSPNQPTLRNRISIRISRELRPVELLKLVYSRAPAVDARVREITPRTQLSRQINRELSLLPAFRSFNTPFASDAAAPNAAAPDAENSNVSSSLDLATFFTSNANADERVSVHNEEHEEPWSDAASVIGAVSELGSSDMEMTFDIVRSSDLDAASARQSFSLDDEYSIISSSIPSHILSQESVNLHEPLFGLPGSASDASNEETSEGSSSARSAADCGIFSAAVDFDVAPRLSLLPLVSQLTEETVSSIRDVISSHIENLKIVLEDVTRLSEFGELPVSVESNGTTLRIHFPNSDTDRVAVLVNDKELQRGRVVEVAVPTSNVEQQIDDIETISDISSGVSSVHTESSESVDEVWTSVINRVPPLTFSDSFESHTEQSLQTMN